MMFRIVNDPAAWSSPGGVRRDVPASAQRGARAAEEVLSPSADAPGAAAVTVLTGPPEPVRTPPRAPGAKPAAAGSPRTDVKA